MTNPRPRDTCAPVDPTLDEVARMWGTGWRRYFFPAFWLVYLGQTVAGVGKYSHGIAAVIGYALVVAFAACYLLALPMGWNGQRRLFWTMFAAALALTAAETLFARNDALVFCVYLGVLIVASRWRFAPAGVLVLTLVTALTPRFVPSWGGKVDYTSALSVALVSLAMFGFFKIVQSNILLAAARAEVARLAAENERSRIARDLHDLLGHSLTTITVKAGLARRLADRDPQRAAAEIAEVEELSRRTLGEVRAAVSGYRDVTLAGELASAREILRAAGIDAVLPGAVDNVDADVLEPFGWVVREAVTNVVRHSRAARCVITVGARWIEIVDDGHGAPAGAGNGLRGLRERLAVVGGTFEAGGGPRGWRARAEIGGPRGSDATRSTDPASVRA